MKTEDLKIMNDAIALLEGNGFIVLDADAYAKGIEITIGRERKPESSDLMSGLKNIGKMIN